MIMARLSSEQLPLLPQDRAEITADTGTGNVGGATEESRASEEVKSLAKQVLERRVKRLSWQNELLQLDVERKRGQFVDADEMIRAVRRANEVVKQSFYALCVRLSEPLSEMTNPSEIRDFLHREIRQVFNDLAYEQRYGSDSNGNRR